MAYQEKCTKCGEYWWTDKAHFCRAKETRSGSPLESVVQPQQECGVPLNPDRSAGSKLRLASRTRIADLECELTEAINRAMKKHGETISYAELTVALSTKMRAWAGYWLKDELENTD
jgi:hypothetical protein